MTIAGEAPLHFLDKFADQSDYAIVGPSDGRTRVLDAAQFPYAAVCHVERDFGNGRFTGCTGFLVSPTVLITAGHCVYSPMRRALNLGPIPQRIRITPGRDGGRRPFGSQFASRWFAHERFVRRIEPAFDYGVVTVPRVFPGLREYFRLLVPSEAKLDKIRAQRLLHISGYPGDKPPGTQWEHAERLDRIGPRSLYYSVDTCPGHSGAPVWVSAGPGRDLARRVVAIHVAGPRPHASGPWGCRPGVPVAPAGMTNRGIRMTTEIPAAIRAATEGRPGPLMRLDQIRHARPRR